MSGTVPVRDGFERRYVGEAPLALSLERALECRVLAPLPFRRPVLDLGCGDGLFAEMLFDEPLDVGLDPDAEEIARARERGTYRLLLEAPGSSIPQPDGSFQTVLSNSVLEHIRELDPVFKEVLRVLAPGGRFYLTVPTDRFERDTFVYRALHGLGLRAAAEGWARRFNAFWRHFHALPPGEWAGWLGHAGFEVEDVQAYDPARVAMVNDALVPLALPGLLAHRLRGRWSWSPGLRRRLSRPFSGWVRAWLRGAEAVHEGALVRIVARKPVGTQEEPL